MKRSKKMLIYLAALIVLVGGYVLTTSLTKKAEVSQESGSFTLSAAKADKVTSLSWQNGNAQITLEKKDGQWQSANDAAFPVDQDAVQALCFKLIGLTASRKLTGITEMADFGLLEPSFYVTFTQSGEQITYAQGADTVLDNGHYLSSTAEKDCVFISQDALSTMFDKSLAQLAKLEALPSFDEYTRLSVKAAGLTVLDQTYDAENESQHWRRTGAVNEPAQDSLVDGVITATKSLVWDELAAYKADDLDTYGLNEAAVTDVAVYQGGTAVWRVLLGGTDESGRTYAKLPESDMIYLIPSETASALIGVTDDSARLKSVGAIPWDSVMELSYAYDGTQHNVTLSRESAAVTALKDGLPADAQAWKNAYEAFTSISVTGVSPAVNNSISALDITVTGLDGTVHQYAMRLSGVDSYLMDTGVERPLIVSADDVDKLIRTLKSL